MDVLKFWLKCGIALEIVFHTILCIVDVYLLSYSNIPTRIFSCIITCGILAIALYIINKIIELEKRIEDVEESLTNFKSKEAKVKADIERKISHLNEKSFTSILPATYNYNKGHKVVVVKGKIDYSQYIGFKCPLCGEIQRACNLSCKACNVRVEYDGDK